MWAKERGSDRIKLRERERGAHTLTEREGKDRQK